MSSTVAASGGLQKESRLKSQCSTEVVVQAPGCGGKSCEASMEPVNLQLNGRYEIELKHNQIV